ncbi:hypothetical protein [Chitinophaga nivalis]|uniref:Lipoprotein n=1 Tax=Chitinophaga nivalis TaxID=2991709 RepID=A0ABT3IQ33_9BACT|nr:hypothetical protein [Chitinophaga nivalis]MCW3464220.1 hypothetical protein [Chitinophaga nivalis]MCW3486090.1 hypothetical protein [Chitinophaga nivalis]
MMNNMTQRLYAFFITGSLVLFLSVLSACNSVTPDRFFQTAVLNSNILSGFNPEQFGQELEQNTVEFPDIPASKKKGDEAQNIVKNKIAYIEKVIKDVKDLPAGDEDTKAIKAASLQLFEAALPAYQQEYTAYAKLCDTHGPAAEKEALLQKINEKYTANVEKAYDALLSKGKVFADKNNLPVNWGK